MVAGVLTAGSQCVDAGLERGQPGRSWAQNLRRYADDDLPRLARRLESDATNELDLFLATGTGSATTSC